MNCLSGTVKSRSLGRCRTFFRLDPHATVNKITEIQQEKPRVETKQREDIHLSGGCAIKKTISLLILITLVFGLPLRTEAKTVARLHFVDLKEISRIKQVISRDRDRTVLFVGDSVVYSSAARFDKDTIPSFFANLLEQKGYKNTHVYDLSLSGCSFTDTYEILKFVMPSRPDYVICDLNVAWFDAKGRSYRTLLKLHDPAAIEKDQPAKITIGEHMYTRWDKKKWDHLDGFPVKLGNYNYSQGNEQWQAFLKIAALLKQYPDTKVIMFLPPRNYALYSRYKLVDQSLYLEKTAFIKKHLPPNVICCDYTWKVESQHFSDIVHMLPQGNKKTAAYLFNDYLKLTRMEWQR
ncbi:MAG: hypothetical protein ACM3UW_09425 [Bacillota bacterium]